MWCVVSWKTLNTRLKNQDGALMCVIMFLYNHNYPTTTTGWGWTWTSNHQPPVHVQGWSRLNYQTLVTSEIVNQTFTKMERGPKSANNQNSFESWTLLCCIVLLDCFHCLFWTKTNYIWLDIFIMIAAATQIFRSLVLKTSCVANFSAPEVQLSSRLVCDWSTQIILSPDWFSSVQLSTKLLANLIAMCTGDMVTIM